MTQLWYRDCLSPLNGTSNRLVLLNYLNIYISIRLYSCLIVRSALIGVRFTNQMEMEAGTPVVKKRKHGVDESPDKSYLLCSI